MFYYKQEKQKYFNIIDPYKVPFSEYIENCDLISLIEHSAIVIYLSFSANIITSRKKKKLPTFTGRTPIMEDSQPDILTTEDPTGKSFKNYSSRKSL